MFQNSIWIHGKVQMGSTTVQLAVALAGEKVVIFECNEFVIVDECVPTTFWSDEIVVHVSIFREHIHDK
jgi:hypothetical protein